MKYKVEFHQFTKTQKQVWYPRSFCLWLAYSRIFWYLGTCLNFCKAVFRRWLKNKQKLWILVFLNEYFNSMIQNILQMHTKWIESCYSVQFWTFICCVTYVDLTIFLFKKFNIFIQFLSFLENFITLVVML